VASERQYDWFKFLYDEETARYNELGERAKTYISIITIYGGIVLFKADSIKDLVLTSKWATASVYGIALFLVGALVAIVVGLRIRQYEAPADPIMMIDELGEDETWEDDSFFDERITDLAVATKRTATENDGAANWLTWVPWLLFGAVAANFSLILSILLEGHAGNAKHV
jgi:hypothetical protein